MSASLGDFFTSCQSISIVQQLVSNRMFPLTLKGLEEAMRMLSK